MVVARCSRSVHGPPKVEIKIGTRCEAEELAQGCGDPAKEQASRQPSELLPSKALSGRRLFPLVQPRGLKAMRRSIGKSTRRKKTLDTLRDA